MAAYHNVLSKNYEDTFTRMLSEIGKSAIEDISLTSFLPVIGDAYVPGQGLLIIGRAVNGWEQNGWGISELEKYEKCQSRFIAIREQTEKTHMSWVTDLAGPNKIYNTNRSAFWRVIKKIVLELTKIENNWPELIAWTNLCKVSPHQGGNPQGLLWDSQLKSCQELIKMELEELKPLRVLVLAGESWYRPFLKYLEFSPEKANGFVEGFGRRFSEQWVLAKHPQGKNEKLFVSQVIEAFQKLAT